MRKSIAILLGIMYMVTSSVFGKEIRLKLANYLPPT